MSLSLSIRTQEAKTDYGDISLMKNYCHETPTLCQGNFLSEIFHIVFPLHGPPNKDHQTFKTIFSFETIPFIFQCNEPLRSLGQHFQDHFFPSLKSYPSLYIQTLMNPKNHLSSKTSSPHPHHHPEIIPFALHCDYRSSKTASTPLFFFFFFSSSETKPFFIFCREPRRT